MNFQNKYTVELACASDVEGINQVFANQSFSGGIAVAYLRNPDTLASYGREGSRTFLIIIKDREEEDRIIGLGGCLIRDCLIAGKKSRAGYLTGLKLLPEYQKKIFFIPLLYQEMHRLTRDLADIYYTTILSDNEKVYTMMEKKRKSMPEYRYMGIYHTYFCKTGKQPAGARPGPYRTKQITADQAAAFYDGLPRNGRRNVLGPAGALQDDLKNGKFYGVYDNGKDNLLAAGYVLDQRPYKQYVVLHYEGVYRILSRLPVSLLGYPSFPRPGQTANCASAAIWYDDAMIREPSRAFPVLKSLWQGMKELSAEHHFLIIGCHETSPLLPVFRGEKKIDYTSRFYQVLWNGGKVLPEDAAVQAEVAFL